MAGLPHRLQGKNTPGPLLMALTAALPALAQELARGFGTALSLRAACPRCPDCAPVLHCAAVRCAEGLAPALDTGLPIALILITCTAVVGAFFCGLWIGHRRLLFRRRSEPAERPPVTASPPAGPLAVKGGKGGRWLGDGLLESRG